jgi:hypothetical protein
VSNVFLFGVLKMSPPIRQKRFEFFAGVPPFIVLYDQDTGRCPPNPPSGTIAPFQLDPLSSAKLDRAIMQLCGDLVVDVDGGEEHRTSFVPFPTNPAITGCQTKLSHTSPEPHGRTDRDLPFCLQVGSLPPCAGGTTIAAGLPVDPHQCKHTGDLRQVNATDLDFCFLHVASFVLL